MDEERAMELIESVERGGLISAPSYLKREILERVEQEEQKKHERRRRRKAELILYTLEVSAVTAAAVALILLSPVWMPQQRDPLERTAELEAVREQIGGTALEITGRLVTWGGVLHPEDRNPETEEDMQ